MSNYRDLVWFPFVYSSAVQSEIVTTREEVWLISPMYCREYNMSITNTSVVDKFPRCNWQYLESISSLLSLHLKILQNDLCGKTQNETAEASPNKDKLLSLP